MKILRLLVNLFGFDAGWTACVLLAARGLPLLGASVAMLNVIIHVVWTTNPRAELKMMLPIAALGVGIDCLLLSSGLLTFQGSTRVSAVYVLWMIAFWLNFATLIRISLFWLWPRLWLAAALGAVSAPITYYIGHRLGALGFADQMWRSLTVIAVEWGLIMPLWVWWARVVFKGDPGITLGFAKRLMPATGGRAA